MLMRKFFNACVNASITHY